MQLSARSDQAREKNKAVQVAVKFLEERDLVAQFGDTYRDYQRRVPMLLPLPKGDVGSPQRGPASAR